MWTPRKTSTGKQTSYGLGFRQWNYVDGQLQGASTNSPESELKDKITIQLIGHSGSQEKTKTLLALGPSQKFGMVLMANSEHTKIYEIAEALLKAMLQEP